MVKLKNNANELISIDINKLIRTLRMIYINFFKYYLIFFYKIKTYKSKLLITL